jgi:hypothetical protein
VEHSLKITGLNKCIGWIYFEFSNSCITQIKSIWVKAQNLELKNYVTHRA